MHKFFKRSNRNSSLPSNISDKVFNRLQKKAHCEDQLSNKRAHAVWDMSSNGNDVSVTRKKQDTARVHKKLDDAETGDLLVFVLGGKSITASLVEVRDDVADLVTDYEFYRDIPLSWLKKSQVWDPNSPDIKDVDETSRFINQNRPEKIRDRIHGPGNPVELEDTGAANIPPGEEPELDPYAQYGDPADAPHTRELPDEDEAFSLEFLKDEIDMLVNDTHPDDRQASDDFNMDEWMKQQEQKRQINPPVQSPAPLQQSREQWTKSVEEEGKQQDFNMADWMARQKQKRGQ